MYRPYFYKNGSIVPNTHISDVIPDLKIIFSKTLNSSVSYNVNEENTHKLEQNRVNLLNERINRNTCITQNVL
jgi:hypothetical protein